MTKKFLKTNAENARKLKILLNSKTSLNSSGKKSTLQGDRRIYIKTSARIYKGAKLQSKIPAAFPLNKTAFELWNKGQVHIEQAAAAGNNTFPICAIEDSRKIENLSGYYTAVELIGDYFPALIYGNAAAPIYTDSAFNCQTEYTEGLTAFKIRAASSYDSTNNCRLAILATAGGGGGGASSGYLTAYESGGWLYLQVVIE